jgi:hypothetical protein
MHISAPSRRRSGRALDATAAEFPLWEAEGEERYVDEFGVSGEDVAEMTTEWRLAYVGRLVRTLALCYGVSTVTSTISRPC